MNLKTQVYIQSKIISLTLLSIKFIKDKTQRKIIYYSHVSKSKNSHYKFENRSIKETKI